MVYLVLFHCSFTAEKLSVEYIILTKTDIRCHHQGLELASAILRVCRTPANIGANPELSFPCPALKDKGFLLVVKGKALN